MSAVQDVLALNEWLQSLREHVQQAKVNVRKAIEAAKNAGVGGGPPAPNGGGVGGEAPPWTGEMPPWAFDFNQANNPNLGQPGDSQQGQNGVGVTTVKPGGG